jgi:hypothetical protein
MQTLIFYSAMKFIQTHTNINDIHTYIHTYILHSTSYIHTYYGPMWLLSTCTNPLACIWLAAVGVSLPETVPETVPACCQDKRIYYRFLCTMQWRVWLCVWLCFYARMMYMSCLTACLPVYTYVCVCVCADEINPPTRLGPSKKLKKEKPPR